MRFTITFHEGGSPPDVTVKSHGRPDVAGVQELRTSLVAHPSFRPGLRVLVDHSDLEGSFDATGAQEIGERLARNDEPLAGATVAVVAKSPVLFGSMRVAFTYYDVARRREGRASEPGLRLGVFTTQADAVAWLRDPVDRHA